MIAMATDSEPKITRNIIARTLVTPLREFRMIDRVDRWFIIRPSPLDHVNSVRSM